jgi:hypothetical protein
MVLELYLNQTDIYQFSLLQCCGGGGGGAAA